VRPAKSAPRSLLVNRFAVLDVEEVNTDISKPIDAPSLSSSAPDRIAQPQKPKWEKKLPKRLSINTLDARRTSIILPIEVSTTDTSEVHSIKALLDSGATVMNIEWDYNYYQPWSDNEWLVNEMLAMLDEDVMMQ